MNKATVSVIIPNYNNAKYLRKCLDSVLHQTYRANEIIVFDDCSTDGSRDILHEYESSHSEIKVIYSDINCGVSMARHKSIMASNSQYFTTIDSDDYYFSNKKIEMEMHTVCQYQRKSGRPIIAFTQRVDVSEKGVPLKEIKLLKNYWNVRFGIATRTLHQYMPRDLCVPKDIYIASGGYNFERKLFEDWELTLKYLRLADFVYAHEFGTAYRHKYGGLSDVDIKKIFKGKKAVYKEQKDVLPYKFMERIVFNVVMYLTYWGKCILNK